MPARLKVDLSIGLLEVEGEEGFVREMHAEFQRYATAELKTVKTKMDSPDEQEELRNSGAAQEPTRRRSAPRARRRAEGVDESQIGVRPSQYSPMVLKDLNLSGLKEFYAKFDVKTHFDKILVFATYLRDEKDLHPVTADQLFTAYRVVGERPPGAFLQAIRDASTKKNLVDYKTPENITISHIGDDRFLHDLPRKAASA